MKGFMKGAMPPMAGAAPMQAAPVMKKAPPKKVKGAKKKRLNKLGAMTGL